MHNTQIKAKKDEGVRDLLNRSANQIITQIEDYWKTENLLKFSVNLRVQMRVQTNFRVY